MLDKGRILCYIITAVQNSTNTASADSAQVPPVPIPNTVVKLSSAENTCLETDREDREVLAFYFAEKTAEQLFTACSAVFVFWGIKCKKADKVRPVTV